MIAAIDFDNTIWNPTSNCAVGGARAAINLFREKGIKVVIHSCNNPQWIERCLNDQDIRFDWIWTEKGKPVADLYIDDRGFHFTDWSPEQVNLMLYHINSGNPMIKR